MAIQKTYGFDTNGDRWTTFKPFVLNPATLVLKKDEPDEVVMEAKTSPYDRPETFTWGAISIKDVYKIHNVSPGIIPNTTRGIQLLCKYNGFVTVTDTDLPGEMKVLPVQIRTTMVVPINQYITEADLNAMLQRAGGMFLPGSLDQSTASRLAELMRNALKPTT